MRFRICPLHFILLLLPALCSTLAVPESRDVANSPPALGPKPEPPSTPEDTSIGGTTSGGIDVKLSTADAPSKDTLVEDPGRTMQTSGDDVEKSTTIHKVNDDGAELDDMMDVDFDFDDDDDHDSDSGDDDDAKHSKDDDYYNDEEGEHDALPFDSFIGAFLSILVTEIGDKTFLIAALMAMRHPRIQVFTAAACALVVMTILSALTGHAVGSLMSKRFTALIAGLLFLLFGAKSMKEGLQMSPDQGVSEEMEEVRAELEEKEESMARHAYGRRTSSISPYALEAGRAGSRQPRSGSRLPVPPRSPSESPSRSGSPSRSSIQSIWPGLKNLLSLLLSPAWVETFAMTFVGELGDRSQIATVAMAAGQEYVWIMIGATLGHLLCTAGAVLGGSALAGKVSMRKVTIIGAWIFLAFGLYTFYEALSYWHD